MRFPSTTFIISAATTAWAFALPAAANPNPNDLAYRYEKLTEHAGRSPLPQPREVFASALPFERTTELTPDVPDSGVVAWQDAAKYLGGDPITVEGRIVDTFQTNGPVVRLQFARFRDDPDAFYVALFDEAWKGTTIRDAARHFAGKILRVTGPVTEFRGNPNIEVRDLDHIEIIGRR
ncbi:MAG: hypothetical protein AAGE65_08255 [Planctomycetota bacterium]